MVDRHQECATPAFQAYQQAMTASSLCFASIHYATLLEMKRTAGRPQALLGIEELTRGH